MSDRNPLAIFRADPPAVIKAVSVRQPFASWIANGVKTIETKTWYTKYRGKLLIHASKQLHQLAIDGAIINRRDAERYPRGKMLCVVDLVDVRPMVESDQGSAECSIYDGAFAWVLENPRPVVMAEMKGQLGLFNVDMSMVRFLDPSLKMYVDNSDCDFVIAISPDQAKLLWTMHHSHDPADVEDVFFEECAGEFFTFSESSSHLAGATKTVAEWISIRGQGWFATSQAVSF